MKQLIRTLQGAFRNNISCLEKRSRNLPESHIQYPYKPAFSKYTVHAVSISRSTQVCSSESEKPDHIKYNRNKYYS